VKRNATLQPLSVHHLKYQVNIRSEAVSLKAIMAGAAPLYPPYAI
jgi:hypothetical protein